MATSAPPLGLGGSPEHSPEPFQEHSGNYKKTVFKSPPLLFSKALTKPLSSSKRAVFPHVLLPKG